MQQSSKGETLRTEYTDIRIPMGCTSCFFAISVLGFPINTFFSPLFFLASRAVFLMTALACLSFDRFRIRYPSFLRPPHPVDTYTRPPSLCLSRNIPPPALPYSGLFFFRGTLFAEHRQGARKSALLGDGLLRRQQARRQRIRGRQHLHLGHQQQQVGGAEAAGAQR